MMKATNIQWDIDGNRDIGLPEEIEIPDEVICDYDPEEDYEELLDIISDYISDETGFCHNGFEVEI